MEVTFICFDLIFRQERINIIELEINNPDDTQRAPDDEAYLTPVNNSVDVNIGSVHYYSTID